MNVVLLLFFQLEVYEVYKVYKTNYKVMILNFKSNYKAGRSKQINQAFAHFCIYSIARCLIVFSNNRA